MRFVRCFTKALFANLSWEFVALNIDDEYERGVHSQLKCACGRPLKYQFVIESKSKQQEIRLGIQHFKDHLGISQQVAEEIKRRRLCRFSFG